MRRARRGLPLCVLAAATTLGLLAALAAPGAIGEVRSSAQLSRSAPSRTMKRARAYVYLRAHGLPAHTGPQLFLEPSQKLPASFHGAEQVVSRFNAGRAHPVAEASADLNHDGIGDLLVGYVLPEGGAVAFYRGNQNAFAPRTATTFGAIRRNRFPSPFFRRARVISLPVRPDFLAAGTFASQSSAGFVAAARGGHAFYVFAGDGTGRFGRPRIVRVPGSITTLAAGAFGRSRTTVFVGISARQGHSFSLLAYGQTQHGLRLQARYRLGAAASAIQVADFGDPGQDALLLAGGRVLALRSATMRLRPLALPFSVVAMSVGLFIYDRHASPQLALLTRDGALHFAAHPQFDPRPYSASEWTALRRAGLRAAPSPLRRHGSLTLRGWKVVETIARVAPVRPGRTPLLLATRVSSHAADDVVVLDAATRRMTVVEHPDLRLGAKTFRRAVLASRSSSGSTVAAVAVRVNVDGRPGLLTIDEGEVAPFVMMPLPDPTFTVNRTDDPAPVSPITNACNGVANDCSIREAILRANATAGTDTVMVPAGTYTLTRPKVAGDYSGNNGALYVNDSVNIVGAGQNTTIIQAGTTAYNAGTANGVDMVMAVNEDINPITNATASISGLTLQNGHNVGTHGNDGDGGCMEFDTGSSGTANLTFTNVTLQNCDTTKGNGAGIAIFNFVAPGNGLVTFTNSIVQGNSAVDSTAGVAAGGGGIWVSQDSRMSMTGSQVLNNKAAQVTGGVGGIGGGVFIFNNTPNSRQTVIHSSTISGNQASSQGGGIFNSANLLVDQGTVISGNSAGTAGVVTGEGGGIYDNTSSNGCPSACTDTLTLNKVTITGNNSTGSGGGIYHGNLTGAGSLTMTLSRLAGNTATTAGSNLFEDHSVANVTDNWWGTNSPSGTITNSGGTTTFSPFIVLTNTASPNPIKVNQTTTLTADFLHDSNGGSLTTGQITVLLGLPLTWGNAIKGSLSNQQTTIQSNGTATATFTASAAGAGNADATVDNGKATGNVTINKANTTATITSDSPDPTVTGQGYTVNFGVSSETGSTPTAPTGNVTVSDGTDSCTGAINASLAGSCTLTSSTAGSKTLTATYNGDGNFNVSPTSAGVAHTVNKADTTTTITADNPDPSVVGQPVPVHYSVSVNAPGGGMPTGNVTVSDGTVSCTATVAAGQCSLTFTSAGTKSLSAIYGGDSNYNASPASAAATHQVNPADTTTSITSDTPDPSFVGQTVTVHYLVVVVAPGAGTPTGNVTVTDGVDSCTGTVAAGMCDITLTTAGNRTLTAHYAGDANFNGSTSAGEPHIVNKIPTTTAITSDLPDPSVVGQSVTVQYSVTPSSAGTPTGNVTVSDGTVACTATVAAGQCSLTFTNAGAKSLTATYAGDSNFNGSTSSAEPHQVNKADTNTTITSDAPDPSVVGQPVTVGYSVAAVAPGAGTPTGNVTVSDGAVSCTATVAAGQCSLTFTSAGAKSLTATYAGDSNFNASTSAAEPHQVNAADTTTTIVSDNPDPSVVGQSVTVQYNVTVDAPGAGTPTGTVTVSDGTVSCTGTVAAGQCSLTFTSAGAKSLTATYAGDSNFNGSTSSAEPHQVNKADTNTTITSDNPDPSNSGQAVTVNYSVAPVAPGAGTPTGTVTVTDGIDSCTATVASGTCDITLTTIGNRTLTATYAGDSNFNGGASAGEPHMVNGIATTTSITSDLPDPSVVGQVVTVQYTVTPAGAGTPAGNVTVSDGAVSCTGTVAAGQCPLTFTTAGAKSLTATYGGDSIFGGSTSAAEAHQVSAADTATSITSDTPNPSVVGQPVTVGYSVAAVAPGAGTPTGNVTVSDGTASCTATVAAGQCSLTFTSAAAKSLMFTSAGAKSLTATYAGDSNFNGSTSAAEPHQVNAADTTTTIVSDNPDPSVVGQSVTVQYNVTVNAPGAGTPTGNVTVSDGTVSCTGTVAAGQCALTFTTSGPESLTATYAGDSNFNGSMSVAEPHTVNGILTTATIASDNPDPSVVGQSVTVQYLVASASGTPTGNVTVSDGTVSCTDTVAAGQCSLTFTAAGAKSLTATYAGDSTFSGSTSATEAHQVNKADTTTAITSDNPDPSPQGAAVTVHYSVVVNAPGAGAPGGSVTVSDGVDSCTGTAAAGQCSIALTTIGSRTLTATYAGDANFNGSTSAGEPHTVNPPPTATVTATAIHDAQHGVVTTVAAGAVVHDLVTVTGVPQAPVPSGNVTLDWFTNADCSGSPAKTSGTVALDGSGRADATAFAQGPLAAGSYAFTAHYLGDATNAASDGPCEPLHVVDANVQVGPSATNPVGGAHTFTVHVTVNSGSGGFVNAADGTSINLTIDSGPGAFTSANPCTTSGGTGSCSITLVSNATGATVVSAHVTLSVGGLTLARSSDGTGGSSGPATELWASSTARTDVMTSSAAVTTVTAGTAVHDQVFVAKAAGTPDAAPAPAGNVMFHRYTTLDCTGASTDQTVALTPGNPSTAVSDTFTAVANMSYRADYVGNAAYPAATGTCEPLTVTPVPAPAIAIVTNPATQSVAVGKKAKFKITVTNSGNTTLTNATVHDPAARNCNRTSAELPALASMAPGTSVHYSCSRKRISKSFTNVATAIGTPPSGPNVTASDSARVKAKPRGSGVAGKATKKTVRKKVVSHKKPRVTG